jgi:hypothetical protein
LRARAKYSELVGVSRALLATTAPAARSGEPRHPRDLAKSISEGVGEKSVFARAARIPHTRFPTNHSGWPSEFYWRRNFPNPCSGRRVRRAPN